MFQFVTNVRALLLGQFEKAENASKSRTHVQSTSFNNYTHCAHVTLFKPFFFKLI